MNSSVQFQAENIQFLEFELNNQCQYSKSHTWCPRNILGDEPLIELPTDVIIKTIDFFKQYNFNGTIYLSIYNEPTLDPRFIDLCKYIKKNIGGIIQMYTNGFDLTTEKLCSYFDAGVSVARLSNYGKDYTEIVKEVRLRGYINYIEIPNRSNNGWLGKDDRIHIYERLDNEEINSYCYHPIQYFMVSCTGDIMLCWDDWKRTVTFGNLKSSSVEEILINPYRLGIIDRLKKDRKISPCSGCNRPSELCISEYRNRIKL